MYFKDNSKDTQDWCLCWLAFCYCKKTTRADQPIRQIWAHSLEGLFWGHMPAHCDQSREMDLLVVGKSREKQKARFKDVIPRWGLEKSPTLEGPTTSQIESQTLPRTKPFPWKHFGNIQDLNYSGVWSHPWLYGIVCIFCGIVKTKADPKTSGNSSHRKIPSLSSPITHTPGEQGFQSTASPLLILLYFYSIFQFMKC